MPKIETEIRTLNVLLEITNDIVSLLPAGSLLCPVGDPVSPRMLLKAVPCGHVDDRQNTIPTFSPTIYVIHRFGRIMTVTIAYMGIPGSNSEQAAVEFAAKMGWDGYELLPRVDSRGVVDAMDLEGAEYGVVAVANINAGPVEETRIALEGRDDIEFVLSFWVPIHHCVFVKEGYDGPVRHIASHIQALLQTKGNLERLFPDADRIEVEDTAVAAEYLSEGKLSKDTAVVCRRNAGQMFGLRMIHENIEDRSDNMTEFHLLRKGSA